MRATVFFWTLVVSRSASARTVPLSIFLAVALQVRRNPYVQGDADLKEMLLDAFESRCVAHSQQPVYHMAPLPRNSWSGWGNQW